MPLREVGSGWPLPGTWWSCTEARWLPWTGRKGETAMVVWIPSRELVAGAVPPDVNPLD